MAKFKFTIYETYNFIRFLPAAVVTFMKLKLDDDPL